MKKFLSIFASIVFLSGVLFAELPNKIEYRNIPNFLEIKNDNPLSFSDCECSGDECIDFTYRDEKLCSMSVKEFQFFAKSAYLFREIWDAEKKGRVKAILKDNPWNITTGKNFKTTITMYWYNKKGEQIKYIVTEFEFKTKREGNMSKIRIIYRDICEYAAPISVAFNVIFSVLLAVFI